MPKTKIANGQLVTIVSAIKARVERSVPTRALMLFEPLLLCVGGYFLI